MEDDDKKHELAIALVNAGLKAQQASDIERAIKLYHDSINIWPTAEGYTYLGWALSKIGKLEEAIDNCREAIAIDPEFGNPYNDIGVYLMHRDRPSEAIPWLERAKTARRYEPRHFPYMNLGRIYAARGELKKAIEEFQGALENVPEGEGSEETTEGLREVLADLQSKLN